MSHPDSQTASSIVCTRAEDIIVASERCGSAVYCTTRVYLTEIVLALAVPCPYRTQYVWRYGTGSVTAVWRTRSYGVYYCSLLFLTPCHFVINGLTSGLGGCVIDTRSRYVGECFQFREVAFKLVGCFVLHLACIRYPGFLIQRIPSHLDGEGLCIVHRCKK